MIPRRINFLVCEMAHAALDNVAAQKARLLITWEEFSMSFIASSSVTLEMNMVQKRVGLMTENQPAPH